MNNLIFAGSIFFYLGCVLGLYRLFGKTGLFIFTIFSTILGNIQVCKCVDIFGFATTAGNVLYASTFLVTDILSEKYGKKEAARAVQYGICITLLWIAGTQLTLLLVPNGIDRVDGSLRVIFGLVPRISIASLLGYACSQTVDVFLYHAIWRKTGGSEAKLWVRNNCSTLTSQAVDTVIFTFLAFWGTCPLPAFVSILLTTYFFKAVVALLDTPFAYLARKITPRDEADSDKKSPNAHAGNLGGNLNNLNNAVIQENGS